MARTDNEVRITPSVLDRLLDLDPRSTQEAPTSRSTSLQELKKSVRRDLEWLLNTRCHQRSLDGGLEESLKSVAFYGLPDFTGTSGQNTSDQRLLIKSIETALKNFEPRFLDIKITLEPIDNLDRQLKFRIEARLDVDPVPEPVVFDTVLQVGKGEFVLTEK